MQTIFYRFVQPGRNEFNTAFSVGTNVLYRREAVLDVDGLYTDSKSEDVWTSLMLHEAGWRTVYIAKTLAIGDAPDTIEAYAKQQLRWATGGFEILFTHNPLSRRHRLTADQRLMYLVTATHYLTGAATGLLLFVPALEIFFDLRPVNVTPRRPGRGRRAAQALGQGPPARPVGRGAGPAHEPVVLRPRVRAEGPAGLPAAAGLRARRAAVHLRPSPGPDRAEGDHGRQPSDRPGGGPGRERVAGHRVRRDVGDGDGCRAVVAWGTYASPRGRRSSRSPPRTAR